MSTVNGFQVGSETLKYNYESLDNYNTPNFSTSSSKAYAVGDYVMYNGKLYKCTTATTGGTWVSSSWALAVLSDDVNNLSRQLSDVEENQIPELKSALSEVVEETETEKTKDVPATWSDGILQVDGNVSTTSSYIYSNKIAVNEGDIIRIKRSDGADIIRGVKMCAYNGDTVITASGKSDDFDLPITIGSGINFIAITLPAAYRSGNPHYQITYTEQEATPKVYLKTETYSKEEIDELVEDAGKVKTVNGISPDTNGNVQITPEKELVTQISQIVSVQKEVVQSQVDVVDSARNAANNGVLPSNDGTTNFTNLQAMLDVGGTIVVDVPGIYEINGMLQIGSDTELIFGKQVYMKQMNSVGGFIVNKGAATGVYNENIRIKGLNIICNGMTGDSSSYKFGLRGKIAFCFVKNVILDEIYVDDIPAATYFIHIAAYDGVLIQNSHIEGSKDGIHSACGNHLTIRNCYFNTLDDPIALNCQDYPASIPYYGWIKNVLIEDCVDASPAGTGGAPRARSILFYGGAWLDWASGNTYRNGDTVVATNGYIYRLISTTAISDETAIESTVEPTHSSGRVTESDGCTWQFIQEETVYNVACANVTVRNYYVRCPRVEVFRFHDDNTRYVRSIYPNAIMPPHSNFVFDCIFIDNEYATSYFVGIHEPVDSIRTVNSKVRAIYIYRFDGSFSLTGANEVTNLAVIGNDFYRGTTGDMVLVLLQQAGKTVNVKTCGNYKTGSMSNSISQGVCNMLANDLF